MRRITAIIFVIIITVIFIPGVLRTSALIAREVPEYDSPVMDLAGILNADEERVLERKIIDYRDSTAHEIGVLIITSLEGDDLETYANRVYNSWGIGGAEVDNGALLLIAMEERKIRLEVGYGLEAALTDIESGHIVGTSSDLAALFRQQQWATGIGVAIDGIIAAIGGEYVPEGPRGDMMPWYVPWLFSVFIFLMIFGIIAMNIRAAYTKAKLAAGGKSVAWTTVLGSGWSSGSRGRGFSGGSSFGGFSGGSSGGGGASGGW